MKCRGCSAHLEDVVADSDASKPGNVLGASTFPTLRVTKIVVVGENVVIDQTTVASTATHLPHVVNVIIGLNVSSYPRPVAVPNLTVVDVVACFEHAGLRVVGKVLGNQPTDVDDARVCFVEWPTRAVATDGGRAQADLKLTARGVERDAGHALLVVEEPEKSRMHVHTKSEHLAKHIVRINDSHDHRRATAGQVSLPCVIFEFDFTQQDGARSGTPHSDRFNAPRAVDRRHVAESGHALERESLIKEVLAQVACRPPIRPVAHRTHARGVAGVVQPVQASDNPHSIARADACVL